MLMEIKLVTKCFFDLGRVSFQDKHFNILFGHSDYCVCCLVVIVLTCSILSSLSEQAETASKSRHLELRKKGKLCKAKENRSKYWKYLQILILMELESTLLHCSWWLFWLIAHKCVESKVHFRSCVKFSMHFAQCLLVPPPPSSKTTSTEALFSRRSLFD